MYKKNYWQWVHGNFCHMIDVKSILYLVPIRYTISKLLLKFTIVPTLLPRLQPEQWKK